MHTAFKKFDRAVETTFTFIERHFELVTVLVFALAMIATLAVMNQP